MTQGKEIDLEQAQRFLVAYYAGATQPTDITLLGEGAWSRCFGFRRGDQALAIRFGNYVDDFQHDQRAATYATPALPIPQVLDLGEAFGGYYVISTRAYGTPLEEVAATTWRTLVPALVAALEALRTADLTATSGWGGWDAAGRAPFTCWTEHLLAVNNDSPDRRTYGWRERLATQPEHAATFAWGYDLLRQVATDHVPRSLLHCDLINRNVLVQGDSLSGVFDWGCSLYGDHLYELAWFEFWAPWMPQLDVGYLRAELERHWRIIGYEPSNKAERLAACYLHIGLDHLAYNAWRGEWATLAATAAQMRALVKNLSEVKS